MSPVQRMKLRDSYIDKLARGQECVMRTQQYQDVLMNTRGTMVTAETRGAPVTAETRGAPITYTPITYTPKSIVGKRLGPGVWVVSLAKQPGPDTSCQGVLL